MPAYLSDCPELCFDTKPDTLWVDIECLHGRDPVLPDATFWHNAAKRLAAARAGIIGRRGPLRVVPQQGGTWLVPDGNATLEAARHYGWKRLPVLEKPAE